MRTSTAIAFVLGSAVLLSGCLAYSPIDIDASSRPVPDLDAIEVLGTAEGESCSHYLLSFIPLSIEEPIHNAYTRARSSNEGADALINVTVDAAGTNFLGLYRIACVTVRGDAIRYLR
ncbi:MAG: hypothetical protein ACE5FL_05535 [Myxococcota bacterium]